MTSMYDRWRDDQEHGDAGVTTGPVSLAAIAAGLHAYGEKEPFERYLNLRDEEALARWKEWMRRYLRRRAEEEARAGEREAEAEEAEGRAAEEGERP